MTDIEKKAREYADKECTVFDDDGIYETANLDMQKAFLAGAAYALAGQWRDAEKEKPEVCVDVVVIYRDRITDVPCKAVAWIDNSSRWHSNDDDVNMYGVVAWLEIPEYEPKGE